MVKMLEDAGNIDTELIEWEGAVHAEVLLSRNRFNILNFSTDFYKKINSRKFN